MKCPQCKTFLKDLSYDVGFGIVVDTKHCPKCGFNVTDEKELNKIITELREEMSKKVKIVRVGEGLGIRFPKIFIKKYNIKKGVGVLLEPDKGSIKIVI